MFKKLLIVLLSSFLVTFILLIYFLPLYNSSNIIVNYGYNSFDICIKYPLFWSFLKKYFVSSLFFSTIIYFNFIYSIVAKLISFIKTIAKKKKENIVYTKEANNINLLIGQTMDGQNIYLNEKSLYQNILVTGTIGTGKTSSAIYPFAKQLIEYESFNPDKKIGMLILDAKGNFYEKVNYYASIANRKQDVIVIDLSGTEKYNPLDKPFLKPIVIANRLKTILTLFSKNNSESYWLDKSEQILSECIKLCRLYNKGYVTFEELHKLVSTPNYYTSKIEELRHLFQSASLGPSQIYDLLSSLEFFEKEFNTFDSRTSSILKSEISRITGNFISDYDILNAFCPKKEEITFEGFRDVINNGKIVVLKMNISKYQILSKIIATYLKLDFQSEVLSSLSQKNTIRTTAFICDEFQEYVTSTDSNFFSQSREAKCINILATQSYSSLLDTINNQSTVKVIIQNLINKLWFRSDDLFTIEEAQKLIGKEDKEKASRSISENAKETTYNYLTKSFNSKDSNLSESISTYLHSDYIYDINYFTQQLETFSCLSFLSTGDGIIKPQKIKLFPYFYNS